MKEEFVSNWSVEQVSAHTDQMPYDRAKFFEPSTSHLGNHQDAVIPDNVPYAKLLKFVGRKTRITIEVIP